MDSLFTTIARKANEDDMEFHKRVAAEITGKSVQESWGGSEIVVTNGYESPYLFGRKLREMVNDYNASVFRFHTSDHQPLYVAFAQDAAVYDPSQRAQVQKPVDYFDAVDELSK